MKTEILPMDDRWLDAVVSIERAAHSHPWAESLLRKPPTKFGCNRVLVMNDDVVGYFFAQCVAGEASLLNIAIAPMYQGKGFGKELLSGFLACMRKMDAQEAWLEVRESNQAAIKLYEALEFNEFDRRYGYYPTKAGKEDALIMSYWFE
ncbi:ribosomal-protein-alanine N-acetyltransferase [Enterovibrio norvegicus FF-162]|uniref:ribosomal protein S18-alanine N-acetyltransferase n=1 Tax=Enterovibrio norvegicus TaxID=188144 RepID=UPI000360272D|nr:ribosomal protein S18-alanine N-acetyltransferase [Enterovibrio norvegicus]OEE85691.1 ribosomal-protein-alanine N-acetyltransferase [Enterovibrio norvegicus FF-162]